MVQAFRARESTSQVARRAQKQEGVITLEQALAAGLSQLDFYWPEADLVVEVDGWSIHSTPLARRRDFRKKNRIVIGNHWVLRYDWVDVVDDADRTAAEIQVYRARTTLALT